MARTFRRARQMHPIAELNITNLVDLGFTLLIIFMIATPLINQNEQSMRVDLPLESKSDQPKPDPKDQFETIVIRADGTYYLGGQALPVAALSRELARLAAQSRPPVIRIRMDAKSTAQQFVTLMDELKKNHLSKITFDTQTAR